ncbi:MAG: NAD(P)H-dependent oxidoreductase subunit E [Verrucomicrobiales bacterium]|nr:NAD(P)H-dependent oxidoreductase subunit E [Verrucomicrobiales bacterium]MCP5528635.1 NAD(P)H-dependent oxidoreductase subunit E [Verrucomicrobiales bacterium]
MAVETPSVNPDLPAALVAEIDEVITHYPQKRSAAVMVLHALQDHFGCLTPPAMEWAAARLGIEPIQVLELVTFYPMFRQEPAGRFHLRICRTLSCALAGSHALHGQLCRNLGLDPEAHGLQTTEDGRFSVEFVECLAACGTPPVMMCNDRCHEAVTLERAEAILNECR